ncbi:MAG: hypothetical protein ACTHK7_09100, partial [Aureliella sp.]
MNNPQPNRRRFVGSSLVTPILAASMGSMMSSTQTAQAAAPSAHAKKEPARDKEVPVRYCLNMSTINSSQIPLREQLKIASDAGYTGVELWLRDVDKFVEQGGDLPSLRREIADLGLTVESAIAFGA